MTKQNKTISNFRLIPNRAFGVKPIVRIRDIESVVYNFTLFKPQADNERFYPLFIRFAGEAIWHKNGGVTQKS